MRVTRTGPEGHFEFRNLPEGNYELTAVLAGFAPARRTLRLVPGQSAALSLTLSVALQEEVVVTASKTGERDARETPIAVSVLPGEELQRAQAHTVAALAGLAPSVTFSQNSDFAQLTVRGIGSNVVFAGSDPSSAVYIDGVYIARPVMVLADFLALERVEVLRGPQGTLYGRNAVGGAVNLVTKPPTNDFEATARFAAGNFDALRGEARLSGPIVRRRVLGSAAILRGTREGYVRDLDHGGHPLGGEDVTAAQGKIHVIFDRRSDLLLSADIGHQEPIPLTYAKVIAVKPGFQVDNPADLHEVRTSTKASSRTLGYGSSARFSLRLGSSTTLTSLTAFRKLDYTVINDADITELELAAVNLREMQRQWSEEVTVSRQGSRLAWIAGLFFFDEVDRQPTSVQLGASGLENVLHPRVDANAAAAFGQATIALTRRLAATAGLRYTRDRKAIVNAGHLSTLDPPVTLLAGTAYAYTDSMSRAAWMPKAGVELRVRDDTFAYASATRGFKSGGFNLTSPEAGRGYAPEWAWSYEGGLKTVMARGRARFNVAAFQVDYSDLQVQTAIRPGVIDISNAAEATIRGVEMDGTIRIRPGIEAGGHVAWLGARYDRYVAVGVGGVMGDVAGRRLNNAPEWAGRLWLQWSGQVGRSVVASARVDTRGQSTLFFTPFNDTIQRQTPYGLVDVSVELGPKRRHWSVGAWARNLANADYITGTFSTPPPAIGGRPGPPRQVGLQLTIRN
jgi:iron complex outermembrane recepter protein